MMSKTYGRSPELRRADRYLNEQLRRDGISLSSAIAGLAAILYSDIADNPPEDFTEEDIKRHREAARKARECQNKIASTLKRELI